MIRNRTVARPAALLSRPVALLPRSAAGRPRPVALLPRSVVVPPLLCLLLQLALLDTGSLSATVALAATAAAGTALAVCSLLTARCAPAVPHTRVRMAIRDRARRTAFLPQRDPDAAGRRRPRAPGQALRTTAA